MTSYQHYNNFKQDKQLLETILNILLEDKEQGNSFFSNSDITRYISIIKIIINKEGSCNSESILESLKLSKTASIHNLYEDYLIDINAFFDSSLRKHTDLNDYFKYLKSENEKLYIKHDISNLLV